VAVQPSDGAAMGIWQYPTIIRNMGRDAGNYQEGKIMSFEKRMAWIKTLNR